MGSLGDEPCQRSKIALIVGVTGQDGSYLAELLLKKGYEVHGLKRKASTFNQKRLDHLLLQGKFRVDEACLTNRAKLTLNS